MNLEIKTLKGGGKVAFNRLTGAVQPLGKAMEKAKMNTKRFKMEWLGVLFGAMAAQRRLQTIMSSSISTFMEVAGANNEANQALAAFGAQWKFLKFTIGSALAEAFAPLLPTFIAFVEWITEFVEQHPEVVAWALTSAIVVLSAAVIGAQFALGMASLIQLSKEWGTGSGGQAAKNLGKFVKKAGGLAALGVGVSFVIEDIFFDEEGDFELGSKLNSALSVGIGAGLLKGVKVGFKAGIWTFIILSAIEIVMDPKGTGKLLAQITNWLANFADRAIKLIREIVDVGKWFQIALTDLSFADAFPSLKKWFDEFGEGFSEEMDRLALEGKIAPSLQMMGFGAGGFESEDLQMSLEGMQTSMQTAKDEAGFLMTAMSNIGIMALPFISKLGLMIGSPVKGSFPLVYALKLAEAEWIIMREVAVENIDKIIEELEKIPTEIVTTHIIRTVRRDEEGGGYRDFF